MCATTCWVLCFFLANHQTQKWSWESPVQIPLWVGHEAGGEINNDQGLQEYLLQKHNNFTEFNQSNSPTGIRKSTDFIYFLRSTDFRHKNHYFDIISVNIRYVTLCKRLNISELCFLICYMGKLMFISQISWKFSWNNISKWA